MNIGLFKFTDIESSTLTFKDIEAAEIVRRLSKLTDSSTNVGFLHGGRKFHGLVTQDKFKLKTIRTFRDDEFIVTGDIKQFGKDVIVNIDFKREIIRAFVPKAIFFAGAVFCVMAFLKTLDFTYLLFFVVGTGVLILITEEMRRKEYEKVKSIFYGLYRPAE